MTTATLTSKELNRQNGCRFTVTFDRDLPAEAGFSAL